jgi:hypothetical protein
MGNSTGRLPLILDATISIATNHPALKRLLMLLQLHKNAIMVERATVVSNTTCRRGFQQNIFCTGVQGHQNVHQGGQRKINGRGDNGQGSRDQGFQSNNHGNVKMENKQKQSKHCLSLVRQHSRLDCFSKLRGNNFKSNLMQTPPDENASDKSQQPRRLKTK